MSITASRALPYLLLAAGFVVFSTVFAQQSPAETPEVDWLQLGMGLFGGLALFLAGLDVLSEGLKKAAGSTLRTVLQKLTAHLQYYMEQRNIRKAGAGPFDLNDLNWPTFASHF